MCKLSLVCHVSLLLHNYISFYGAMYVTVIHSKIINVIDFEKSETEETILSFYDVSVIIPGKKKIKFLLTDTLFKSLFSHVTRHKSRRHAPFFHIFSASVIDACAQKTTPLKVASEFPFLHLTRVPLLIAA